MRHLSYITLLSTNFFWLWMIPSDLSSNGDIPNYLQSYEIKCRFKDHNPLWNVLIILKAFSTNTCYKWCWWSPLVKLLSNECHRSRLVKKYVNIVSGGAWYLQATSRYMCPCWLGSMSFYDVTRPHCVNIMMYKTVFHGDYYPLHTIRISLSKELRGFCLDNLQLYED